VCVRRVEPELAILCGAEDGVPRRRGGALETVPSFWGNMGSDAPRDASYTTRTMCAWVGEIRRWCTFAEHVWAERLTILHGDAPEGRELDYIEGVRGLWEGRRFRLQVGHWPKFGQGCRNGLIVHSGLWARDRLSRAARVLCCRLPTVQHMRAGVRGRRDHQGGQLAADEAMTSSYTFKPGPVCSMTRPNKHCSTPNMP
jgi:hypothetical protein